MDFLERLRRFLRHPVLVPDAQRARHQQHFLAMLERCEAAGASPDWLRDQQSTLGSHLEVFSDFLAAELAVAGIPVADIPELVDAGIALALGVDEHAISITRALVLRSAVERAEANLPRHPWQNVARSAREVHAIRQRGNDATVTTIGRMLLALTGSEAAKWLIHVESVLSTGLHDPWRVDRQTLHALVSGHLPEASPNPGPVFNVEGMERLVALGVVYREGDPDESTWRYAVDSHARPILGELADDRDSPMSILVQAMLDDDIRGLLPGAQPALSTTATVRQARLVVHEIGHTVTPIQVALDGIARTTRAAGIAEQITEPLRRANLGLDRLRSFSSKLDELAQVAGEVPDVFDARAALQEAVRLGQPETGYQPSMSLARAMPRLQGVESRFVLALVTLLRNAYQAAPVDSPRVAVSAELDGASLRIHVDDNGPGVPPAERGRIFLDGYSTRAGGSGRGLALALATIRDDMHGVLTYEDGSAFGGARFVIVVPTYEERTS